MPEMTEQMKQDCIATRRAVEAQPTNEAMAILDHLPIASIEGQLNELQRSRTALDRKIAKLSAIKRCLEDFERINKAKD
jgi:hypothetical protein